MVASVVLCHTSSRPYAAAAHEPTQWLYLAEDYVRRLAWEDGLGPSVERVDSASLLQATAARLRGPFLDALTELGRRHDSLAWWTSRLSERNTMVSPLLLHCCYLATAEQVLREAPGTLCIVCQSRAVLDAIAELVADRGVVVHRVRPMRRARRPRAHAAARTARFVVVSLRRRLAAPETGPAGAPPLVLLRTWVDESCFGPDGVFRDRYYDGLADWLAARGCSVAILPVLYNTGRSDREAWRWFRSSRETIVSAARYVRVADVLFALRVARRQARLAFGRVELDGLDASRLFREERDRAAFDGGSLEALLWHRLPTRLAKAGWRPDVFVDVFENFVDEKALILGFRAALPATRLVGFQHGALSPLLVSNFVTQGEAEFAPLPDRVVCNGADFREILVREGLPPERAVVGAALRYRHLWSRPPAAGARGDDILVTLPLELQAGAELLVKVLQAFTECDVPRVLLKPHPMASAARLFREARVSALPRHFEVVGGSMAESLPRAGVLLSLASSSLHEALAAGVPVVVVGRDAALDLNPLAWYPELAPVTAEPDAIRAETLRLFNLTGEELAAYRRRGEEVLRRSFSSAGEIALRAFVEGLVPLRG